jgi:hypothetical protein
MSPFLVAAKAIPNNLKAHDLLPYSLNLIKGLVARSIKVISYACDGSDVERSVHQEKLSGYRCYVVCGSRMVFQKMQSPQTRE